MIDWQTALAQFHFLRPWWLLGIPAVLLLALWLKKERAAGGEWRNVIAPPLLELLLDRDGRGPDLRPWVILGGLIASLALAGPTWSKQPVPLHEREQALVVLFDLSPSMLATDLTPDRLTRARLKTIDLLKGYDEGSAALVAYAGDAHLVTPMTTDTNTLISQLPVLHPDVMPVAGSNPEAALRMGLELAMNAGHRSGDVLLITDGVTQQARRNLLGILGNFPDFRLSILGAGTAEGAPIPRDEQGFARNSRGEIVVAKLRPEILRGLAQNTGGTYSTITGTDRDIRTLLDPITSRTTRKARELERQLDVWEDRGPWLALALLPLAALMFRRGIVLVLVLAPLTWSPPSHAGFWDNLWWTPDQRGKRALDRGDPERAREQFRDPAWRGIAANRAGDHVAAAEAFSGLDSADAHYNRGNALARAGRLEEALKAYDRALEKAPGMEDATHNRKLVASLLERKNEQHQDREQKDRKDSGGGSDKRQRQPQRQQQGQGDQQSRGNEGRSAGKNQPDSQSRNQGANRKNSAKPGEDSGVDNPGNRPEPRSGTAEPSRNEPSSSPSPDERGREASDSEQRRPSAATPKPQSQSGDEPQRDVPAGAAGGDRTLSREEQQNAEQWLRRVPDDPGGLLRRKFEYESRRRFREEGGAPSSPPDNRAEERW